MIRLALRCIKRESLKLFKILTGCTILYKTDWYKSFFVDIDHEIYPDNTWYRNHEERNYDIVNLGSLSAKYAFDYSITDLKGLNWAQPQTLPEDYQILRHYHSILRKGGYVIITIMPFTGVNKKTGLRDAMKYLKLNTAGIPIQPYMLDEAKKYAEYPILFGKQAIKVLLVYILKRKRLSLKKDSLDKLTYNPMSEEQLQKDAARWMSGWKKQFSIDDFEAPLTEDNQKGRIYRISVMQELIDFCHERGYKPVYVIPPVTKYLADRFTSRFRDIYIYQYLKQVNRNIPLLDYLDNKELMDKDLFFNSFFLNQKGAKQFTERVLKDLNIK